jgi:uncharacterized repeat protein (TIGR01451 family)
MKRNGLMNQMVRNRRQGYWILLSIALLLLATVGPTALAAPQAQTVPPPTQEPPTEEPRATPDDDDDDDDDNPQNQNPTAAPTGATPSAPSAAQPASNQEIAIVVPERLNVRQGPSTAFPVIGVVEQGQALQILERNADGSWLRICCAPDAVEGWVSTPFVQISSDPAQIATLVPPATGTPAPTTVTTPTVTTTATVTITPTATLTGTGRASGPALLDLTIEQEPPFAQQGQVITLTFTITNVGGSDAVAVELRDELPPELSLIEAQAGGNGEYSEETLGANRFAFAITWPALAAGEAISATAQVQISQDLSDGTVFDNLAVASAEGLEPVTSGISIGLPPTTLPTFQ